MSGSVQTDRSAPFIVNLVRSKVMDSSPHILCFGRNPVLLETRCAVLAKHFAVLSVGSLEEMAQIRPSRPFNLVLLCHTLSAEECNAGSEIARHRWPGSKILALTSGSPGCTEAKADRDVSCLDGPRALLRVIQDMSSGSRISGNSASI